MKNHDKLGRRLFTTHEKQPVENYRPDARQLRWMRFLNIHGFASSLFLHEYTSNTHSCKQTSLRRIRSLFDGGMIFRPRQQRETEGADGHHHVYALTEKGIAYLKRETQWCDAIRPTGPWVHQYMIACITSTVHILSDRSDLKFIPGHEITKDLAVEVPFTWGRGRHKHQLIPDSLFAIQYEKGFIAYLVEADRNTEPNDPATPHRKSARRMIKQYAEFIGGKKYKVAYGLNCPLIVLNVSVSNEHIRRVLEIVDEEVGACKYLAFATMPEFETPFRVPQRLPKQLHSVQRNRLKSFTVVS